MKASPKRVLELITSDGWAILPQTLEVVCGLIEMRMSGVDLGKPEIQAALRGVAVPGGMGLQGNGSIAVIPLVGVLGPKLNMMTSFSGGTSLEAFRNKFQKAVADASIGAIIIAIDSPGGSVVGCRETWDVIMAARGTKPIVASVDALMASAALWIGSACDAIEITPSGDAGSLGVYVVHCDQSKANEAAGVKITYIQSQLSPYKTEGNIDEPLSDSAAAYLQKRVDEAARTFLAQVAKGRKLDAAIVEKKFGGGRVLSAQDALAAGMVDRIATFDQTVARLAAQLNRSSSGARAEGTVAVVPHDVSEKLAPKDEPWSALTLEDFTSKTWDELSDPERTHIAGHFAWSDEMPPKTFGSLKLGHHRAKDGAVVYRGVSAALGRLDQTDGIGDKAAVRAHLEHHEKQFEKQEAKGEANPPAPRADHTDVGRDEDGTFHPQCECDPACACMQPGQALCPDNCLTCNPTCACIKAGPMGATVAEEHEAILAALAARR